VSGREVGEAMKGIGSLIGSFCRASRRLVGLGWIPRSWATLHEIPGFAGVWTTEKDYCRHVYTARWRASASASASDRRPIGVFSEKKHHTTPAGLNTLANRLRNEYETVRNHGFLQLIKGL
jgi:hypothetical protein